ncbi:hypothetical protein BGZ70_004006 [Mortierella alpina]|uniref:F-box domain-containing protein n=1 Tax=Mortierella alpina TaxID=64518 RepID=A0A9P6M532_MORAP|nr:hypothetical protein BGZ70_004006 [Mortierella alpina]
METRIHDGAIRFPSDQMSIPMLPKSPFDIPEIASLIASYISGKADLARCARVSHAFHDVFIPILWKSVHFGDLTVYDLNESECRSVFQYGKLRLIEELTFSHRFSNDDMEMIAENCSVLKALNFDGAQVTAEHLAALIPSDPCQARDIHPADRTKRRKTRFPSHLESLSFKNCWNLAEPSCLKIVSSLGPQLKRLSLDGFKDITDKNMIELVRRCPNLIGLQLKGTLITDEFLKSFAQELLHCDSASSSGRPRQLLRDLKLDLSKQISSDGLLPMVMACRCTLRTLSVQYIKSVSDEVLFALVKDPMDKNAITGPNVELETLVLQHPFSLNTVLTEIRLSDSAYLTNTGFQVLFQFATELVSIDLESCRVGDGALMVLAQTYRNRMKALGLGVPAAWREHVLADEKVQNLTQETPAAEDHRVVSTVASNPTIDSRESSDATLKVFTDGHVPGGLKRLYLSASRDITNKGVRAILRSCVGLELLDIGATYYLTLELFHGPWACSRLINLNVTGVALETIPEDLEVIDDDSNTPEIIKRGRARYREELSESSRFPLTVTPYPHEDDLDENGRYDHMMIPLDEYDDDGNEVRDNTPRQRAILREFYSKLGQLSQLRTLNMSYGNYRVRVKDGLELVLPGLQQNLADWRMVMENGYRMGNLELEFLGKHFGYGHDFKLEKDVGQDQLEAKTRKAKLKQLVVRAEAVGRVRRDVKNWAGRQGFHLESPFDIPELAALIASFISDNSDLARCARVSHSLHDICIPILWRTICLSSVAATRVWQNDRGFRMGLIRYSKLCPIEQLHLTHTYVQDGDMELIAENCTRLKALDLTATNVTTETLRVLIHSDPNRTRDSGADEGVKKRKIKAGLSTKRLRGSGEHADEEIEFEDEDGSGQDELDQDASVRTICYPELTETETEREPDSQYESVGIDLSTATESEQDANQPTGPIVVKSRASALLQLPIPHHRCAGTARPVKFKGIKTSFPYFLESLTLKRCPNLVGPSCLEVVSLLGPQLKRLVLNHVSDITDQDMIQFVKRCPNLVELQLRGTEVTDGFLTSFAQEFLPSHSSSDPSKHRQCLENLNLDMTSATTTGLLPMIKACRSSLNTLSMHHLHGVADDVLFALFEDPSNKNATKVSMTGPYLTTQALALGLPGDIATVTMHRFSPNTVLTDIHLAFCSLVTDAGFEILFRFATELVSVDLSGCELKDDTLMVLAETYRNRMKMLGLGIPAAWREHVLAEENRAQAMDQGTAVAEGHQDADGIATHHSTIATPNTAITTSATTGNHKSSIDIDCKDTTERKKQILEENMEWFWRFPSTMSPYSPEEDFDEDGHYDHIVMPIGMCHAVSSEGSLSDEMEDDDSDMEDDDDSVVEDDDDEANGGQGSIAGSNSLSDDEGWEDYDRRRKARKKDAQHRPVPSDLRRNSHRQRGILRAFYAKLGQLSRLRILNMTNCNFRTRVKDGLELVLPALQQNLVEWRLNLIPSYRLQNAELVFFGKHFGYGRDFQYDENGEDHDDEKEQEQKIHELKTRTGKLRVLLLEATSVDLVDPEVLDWAGQQGFHVGFEDGLGW